MRPNQENCTNKNKGKAYQINISEVQGSCPQTKEVKRRLIKFLVELVKDKGIN